jgi:hypothetical protein
VMTVNKKGEPLDGPYINIVRQIRKSWIAETNVLLEKGLEHIKWSLGNSQMSYEQLGDLQKSDDGAVQMRASLEHAVKEAKAKCKGQILTDLLECGLNPGFVKPGPEDFEGSESAAR